MVGGPSEVRWVDEVTEGAGVGVGVVEDDPLDTVRVAEDAGQVAAELISSAFLSNEGSIVTGKQIGRAHV